MYVCLQMPRVTDAMIKDYLSVHEQDLRQKIPDLYYGKFLRSVRSTTVDTKTYICSRVSAEMFKNCVYTVDVCLDEHGVVLQAQCECKAGVGPQAHCKHIAVTLYAITQVETGIITKETCTQQLQTFHQVKAYGGSPVKMQDFNMRRDGSLAPLRHFDPRPPECRNDLSYPIHFRNTWINCPVSSLPIRQLYRPANLHAINVDHDYLAKLPTDIFLDDQNITCISQPEAEKLEIETRGQSSNKKWKFERTKRIHASNFGRICTATDRTNFPGLAKSLTRSNDIQAPAINHGKYYEKIALEAYSAKSCNTVVPCGICVCNNTPYLAASPDGLVNNHGIVEVKCPYTAKDDYITTDSVPYLEEDESGIYHLKKTHQYFYQVQGTLLCTNRNWCDFVVWTLKDMKVIHILRDSDFISDMTNKLSQFFESYFKNAVLEKFYYRN